MKYLLILSFFTLSCCGCLAQSVPLDSFYKQGSAWGEFSWYIFGLGQSSGRNERYVASFDTTINGMVYKLLRMENVGVFGSGSSSSYQYSDYYVDYGTVGAIRTDGSKVYFMRLIDPFVNPDIVDNYTINSFPYGADKLLYDFDLDVGDTAFGQANKIVSAIDSVLINGLYLKRIWLDTPSSGIWVEDYWIYGIGSSIGFLSSYNVERTGLNWGYSSAVCYSDNAYTFLFDTSGSNEINHTCDPSFTFVHETVLQDQHMILYPNPANSEFIIQNTSRGNIYDLFDQAGKLMVEIRADAGKTKVNIDLLANGVYFIKEAATGKYSKLVKQ